MNDALSLPVPDTFTCQYQDLKSRRRLLANRATVHTSTSVCPFKMRTGREVRVRSDIFLPSNEAATDKAPEYVQRLREGIRKTSYSRQKKYYDKHSRLSTHHEGDLVQIHRPIPPPGTHHEFFRPWGRDPFA
ncbi:hypothetical protein TSMEX_006464 [Taenia solium]|eukprot:TsM_001186600 transcript=TsM_001186600 gene=TsM_001186600